MENIISKSRDEHIHFLLEKLSEIGKKSVNSEIFELICKFEELLEYFKQHEQADFEVNMKVIRANFNFTKKIDILFMRLACYEQISALICGLKRLWKFSNNLNII